MPQEALRYLAAQGGRYVDMTAGGGGHAHQILANDPKNELLGLDRDVEAVAAATRRLKPFAGCVHLVHANFTAVDAAAADLGWAAVDGVLMDLGVSSMQIDQPARGFSYRQDGPLDMRMDSSAGSTAADLLNRAGLDELTRIFRAYGDLRRARRLAIAVVERRAEQPWERTGEFAELCRQVLGRLRGRGTPPEALAFQALRIAVNDELGALETALDKAAALLAPGGRLVVISFHSLEDRIVKNFLREAARDYVYRPDLPPEQCLRTPTFEALTRKPLRPTAAEVERNPRAACARLRAARKLPVEAAA